MAAVKFAKTILKFFKWELIGTFPKNEKVLIIAAPHTSIMDFVMGWLGLQSFGVNAKFIIKKEFFFFPVGPIIKALGAVPVKRGDRNNDMVSQMVEKYQSSKSFYLVITPEGTRKKVKRWKKGFYMIADKANVPIVISTVDYGKKQLGVLATFNPTGNYDSDIKIIKEYYRGIGAKYPNCFTIEN